MKKGRPLAYIKITYEELGMYVGDKALIPVCRSWLDPITGQDEASSPSDIKQNQNQPQIEYAITKFE